MTDGVPELEDLLEQCILAHERGDEAGVERLLAEAPALASRARHQLQQLHDLGILTASQGGRTIPEQLGEFRLLRQIGRGGMGVVYLAEQRTLRRRVALKLVHPEQLFFPGARERFTREVVVIARLQHPGIVPILTSGETEGIPFYAMELVHGASLAEVLAELVGTAPNALDGPVLQAALVRAMAKKGDVGPVTANEAGTFDGAWAQICARLVRDAAVAVEYAHGQGVLHRDIKPSNLLLASDGKLRVIDFGLATAEGEQRLTRSGAALGSVPYMAPEQIRGDSSRIDARTDIYQLGVTLYELLTTQLPHGDGSGETRERILSGHVRAPSAQNPLVHPDADAICLKALDVDPARRYQTTDALAQDLEAFLDRRPVAARRPGPWHRASRWLQRHPLRAGLFAALFVVLVPTPLLFALQQRAAGTRIAAALQEALAAVDQMLLRTAEARLANLPGTARLRQQLIEDAIEFQARLGAGELAGDPRLRFAQARSLVRLGSLYLDCGQLADAERALTDAGERLRQLADDHADPVEADAATFERARCLQQLAIVTARTERAAQRSACQEEACRLFEALAERAPTERHVYAWLSAMLTRARSLAREGSPDSDRQFDELDRQLAPAAERARILPTAQRTLLWTSVADSRGIQAAQRGDLHVAIQHFEEAMRRFESVPTAAAAERDAQQACAGIAERLGLAYAQRRQWELAIVPLERAAASLTRLAAAEPEDPIWLSREARILGSLASCHRELRDGLGAADAHDRAITLLERAVARSPTDREFQRSLALAHAERGGLLFLEDDFDASSALADFTLAATMLERLLGEHPDDPMTRGNYVAVLGNHANALAKLRDFAAALQQAERALEVAGPMTGVEAERSYIELLGSAAEMAQRCGRAERAGELLAEARRRAAAFLATAPEDPMYVATAAMTSLRHGMLLIAQDQPRAAAEVFATALPIAERALDHRFGRSLYGELGLRLTDLLLALDDVAAARARFREVVGKGITRDDVSRDPILQALFDDVALQ